MIRTGSRYLRRYFSKTVDSSKLDSQEFMLRSDDTTSIHREGQKSLKIAILGAPNAGKSTLVNQLIKRSVNKHRIIFLSFLPFSLHEEDLKIILSEFIIK